MTNRLTTHLARHVRGNEAPDGELVERFVDSRDEAAFATLVQRHGAMVRGVCRRVLGHEQDAEDVFQAVFLVLSRKAGALRRKDAVGPWLFGVARRLALRSRSAGRFRREKEARVADRPSADWPDDLTVREAQSALDEELARLPERERGPLVLCYLEGLTRDEAAQRLGCPLGTLKARMERARAALQVRLARRGVGLPAALSALLVAGESAAALPPELQAATVRAALAFTSGPSTDGAVRTTAAALAGAFAPATAVRLSAAAALAAAVFAAGAVTYLARIPAGPEPVGAMAPLQTEPLPGDPPRPDWPQWRGPNRDGIVHGVKAPETWPKTLTEEWSVPVSDGYSCPVVVGDRAFVFTRDKDCEQVLCVDVNTGKEVWKSEPYPAPYRFWPGEGDLMKGPRSTPTAAGGRIYTAGVSGVISCFDAGTGTLVWRKPSVDAPPYGGPASPLVTDGLCIVHLGCDSRGDKDGLTAFDAATGEVKWRLADGSRPAAGSPIVADLAGERQVVLFTAWNLRGVSLATGKNLWAVKLDGPEKDGTPLLYKDLIIFADYKQRPQAIRLERTASGIEPREVWKGDGPTPYMSTPVLDGDLAFGASSRGRGSFFCLDARTGKTLWESDDRGVIGYTAAVNAGGAILFLTGRGRLVVAKPTGREYEPIAEYTVSDRQTWAHPVFLGSRILIRDTAALKSFVIWSHTAR
jgi:RNA polymerase sigma factor (sigma-70 family)